MEYLGRAPHRGTLRPEPGSRSERVVKDRAAFHFEIGDAAGVVRVLAVPFVGRDHQRRTTLSVMEA